MENKKPTPAPSAAPWRAVLRLAQEADKAAPRPAPAPHPQTLAQAAEARSKAEAAEKAAQAAYRAAQAPQWAAASAHPLSTAQAFKKAWLEDKAIKDQQKKLADEQKKLEEAKKKLEEELRTCAVLQLGLNRAVDLCKHLLRLPPGANVALFPEPGILLSYTLGAFAPAPTAPTAPKAPKAPRPLSAKSQARKEKADERARKGLGRANQVPRVRVKATPEPLWAGLPIPLPAPGAKADKAKVLSFLRATAQALKVEACPERRQELLLRYGRAQAFLDNLDSEGKAFAEVSQGAMAQLGFKVDLEPSELVVLPFSVRADKAAKRRLLWVGRQIGRALWERRQASKPASAPAPAFIEQGSEQADLALENERRRWKGLAPIAPSAQEEMTAGEAEFSGILDDLAWEVENQAVNQNLSPVGLESEFSAALKALAKAYYDRKVEWNDAVDAVLAKFYAPAPAEEEGGSNA